MRAFLNTAFKQKKDEELILLVQEKSRQAIEELYLRYEKRMMGFFYQMLNKDQEKARDFLHDLFIRCIDKAWLFDPGKKFSTWLYTMAANMCKNEFRSEQIKKQAAVDCVSEISDEQFCLFISGIDENTFRARLSESVRLLDHKHKDVFILRFQEELSICEISEILEIPEGTVKSRIFNCLEKLRNRLVEFDPKI